MCTVLRGALCADRRGNAAESSLGQASHAPSFLSECMNDRVKEARKWPQIALDGGFSNSHMQLVYLDFDAGQEEEAFAHPKIYLQTCVRTASRMCRGC
jgi:hypothetical protein